MTSARPSKERSGRGLFRSKEEPAVSFATRRSADGRSKSQDGANLSSSSLPEVRMSSVGSVVLPSTFQFEPITPASDTHFGQAGGHDGSFKVQGPVLEKTVTDREAKFYELAQAGSWPASFLPKYAGRTGAGSIRIENLTHGLKHPCVIDLKMGFQSVEDSEKSRLKRMKHAALDKVTGSKNNGVRLEGISLSRALEGRRMRGTKAQAHAVSANAGVSLQDVLTFFLSDAAGVRTDVALRFQAHLETIMYHFKRYNNKHLFIGSSILLIWDNDNADAHMRWARALRGTGKVSPDALAGLTRRTTIDVRMIDFAHVGPLPVGQARDFGYIQGLQNIVAALGAIRAGRVAPIFSVAGAAADVQAELAKAAREVRPDESFVAGSLEPETGSRKSRSSFELAGRSAVEFSRPGRRPAEAKNRVSSERSVPPLLKRLSKDSARRKSSEKRTGHIVTFMGQKTPDGINVSESGLPAVRLSQAGSRVLPSTFRFEPVDDSSSASFDQAGGHEGAFKVKGAVLEKAVTDREAKFYELALSGGWPEKFLPKYHGRTDDGEGIHIENLTHNFERPCVMDLKMGFDTVENSEKSMLKKMKHAALDKVTGSKHSGVRLEGMSLYRTLEKKRMKGTKAQSHSVSAHMGISLQDVLTFFLTDESGVRTDIALRFQAHIEGLLHHFKKYNNKHLFIGSSILLIYDNDNASPHMRWARALQRSHTLSGGTPLAPDTLACLTRRTMVDVRMIDFAHVGPLPVGEVRDFGYIEGLKTILAALKEIRKHRKQPVFSMARAALDARAEQAKTSSSASSGSEESNTNDSVFNFGALYEQCTAVSDELRPDESFVAGSLDSAMERRHSRSSFELPGRPAVDFARRGRPPAESRRSRDVPTGPVAALAHKVEDALHLPLPRKSAEKRKGHIVTFMQQERSDDAKLSESGLPAVRLSDTGSRVLPSTFHFEPVPDSPSSGFDQAGGHRGSFAAKGPVLEKTVTDREAKFYELAQSGGWPEQFLPEYHGRTDDGKAIHIENLTHQFEKPCVMDLKMGFHTVEDSEKSLLKKMRHAALDKVTGSTHSGVRLEGMSLYRALEKKRMTGTKAQSHSVSAHMGISLQDVLTFFLTDESGVRTDIALRFQAHIEGLLHHFKKYNNKHLFIGSSILLIYNNDNASPHMRWARALARSHTLSGGTPIAPDTLTGLTRRTAVDVRMIDFAHVGPLPVGTARDFGYIQGLQTVLAALKAIRAHRSRPIFDIASAARDAQKLAARQRAEGGDSASESLESLPRAGDITDEVAGSFTFDCLYSQCCRQMPTSAVLD